ncbi:MAG: type II toxin-antitoxin system RelE/ParE family toxin [Acidimicrobiaceae bacterium]|nr:type II toxin-antitoxin system RelE/ParE family toxin [Acidimicrobiaceae bacterium]
MSQPLQRNIRTPCGSAFGDPRPRHIVQEVQTLKEDPSGSNCKPLVGFHGIWRLRVGDYRVIFSIKDEQLFILVLEVGHRRAVIRGF